MKHPAPPRHNEKLKPPCDDKNAGVRRASKPTRSSCFDVRSEWPPRQFESQDAQGAQALRAHWTPHDLRRTASTQLAKLGVAPHVKEKRLNHALPPMMEVYDHHDYMDERRTALDKLAVMILKLAEMDDDVLEKMDIEGASPNFSEQKALGSRKSKS